MQSTSSQLVSEIVRAGAGAGKTQLLATKVLNALDVKVGGREPRILVCTFTKKATEELRERLLKVAADQGRLDLMDTIASNQSVYISTIHGVLSLFIRRYGHLMDLDSQFQVLSEEQALKMKKKLLRDLWKQSPKIMQIFSDLSADAALSALEDLSSSMIRQSKLAPATYEELLYTQKFGYEKVLKELIQVCGAITQSTSNPKMSDYYRKMNGFLQSSLDSGMMLCLEEWDEFKSNLGNKPPFKKDNPPHSPQLNEDVVNALEEFEKELKNGISEEELAEIAHKNSEIHSFLKNWILEWTEIKRKNGMLEILDLEDLSYSILEKEPRLGAAFAADWDYWLVDEYQDTSPVQVQLIDLLRGSKPEFIVGDPQQSIYLFRGARSEVFDERENLFIEKGFERSLLSVNYRSRPPLLKFFNYFFKRVTGGFKDMEPNPSPQKPDDGSPVATFRWVPKPTKDKSLVAGEDDEGYASIAYGTLFEEIQKLTAKGVALNDICILGRKHAELRMISQDLESWGIPTRVHTSNGFFERREILDALSLLKFLVNFEDDENFVRLVRSPFLRISDADIANVIGAPVELKNGARAMSAWSKFLAQKPEHPVVQKLSEMLAQQNIIGTFAVWTQALFQNHFIDWSYVYDSTGRRESNLWKLVTQLRQKSRTPGFNLAEYLKNAFARHASVEETDAVAALEPNRLHLMTVHKSKGLKFNHVIVPNVHKAIRTSMRRLHEKWIVVDEDRFRYSVWFKSLDDGKKVHTAFARRFMSQIAEREEAESARILYVALTRAAESVVIHGVLPPEKNSWAQQWLGWAQEEGVHETPDFTYIVSHQEFTPEKIPQVESPSAMLRRKWQDEKQKVIRKQVSVTQLLEEQNKQTAQAFTLKAEERLAFISKPVFGTLLHKAMENLSLGIDKITKELFPDLSTEESKKLKESIEYTLSLEEPPIQKMLPHAKAEWGFQLRTKKGIMEGQIDLWFETDTEAWVIDYKSGRSTEVEKAFQQLSLYSYALREFGIQKPIRMAVVYPVEKKCVICEAPAQTSIANKYLL